MVIMGNVNLRRTLFASPSTLSLHIHRVWEDV